MTEKKQQKDDSPTVIYTDYNLKCAGCGKDIDKHALFFDMPVKGKVCLACAGLDHLVCLPSGDTALTKRSRKYSLVSAVVLSYSKSRKQYERQGVLVEEKALEQAKLDCETDATKREIQRGQAAIRRAELDKKYIKRFAARIRELFPHCPLGRETTIAEHACEKYSGRVGRTAEAKELSQNYVELAVNAHIRHAETNYDKLLSNMIYDKSDAREMIRDSVDEIMSLWKHGKPQSDS